MPDCVASLFAQSGSGADDVAVALRIPLSLQNIENILSEQSRPWPVFGHAGGDSEVHRMRGIRVSQRVAFVLCVNYITDVFICGKRIENRQTINEMIGELFFAHDMPEPPKESFFKGLFGGGARSLDREELCKYYELKLNIGGIRNSRMTLGGCIPENYIATVRRHHFIAQHAKQQYELPRSFPVHYNKPYIS